MEELTKLEITDFQSLKDVSFTLGRFTAIVGQSNVGKSAVVRALRLLCENGSSSGYVRKGAKGLQVRAYFGDGTWVSVRRGPRQSEYDFELFGAEKKTFAKCGVAVPLEVQHYLKLSDAAFAGQHDTPFLLSDPGSAVAQRLGDLTNVSVVAEAVRIANRRRLDASQTSRAYGKEFDELYAELQLHRDLKARKAKLAEVRALVDAAAQAEVQVQGLARLVGDARAAGIALREAQEIASRHSGAGALLDEAEAAALWWGSLRGLLDAMDAAGQEIDHAERVAGESGREADQLNEQVERLIHETGVCPVCGSKT